MRTLCLVQLVQFGLSESDGEQNEAEIFVPSPCTDEDNRAEVLLMQHMRIKANFKFTHCLQADRTVNTLCFNWFFASLVQIFVLSIKSNGKADDCSGIHQKMITCSAASLSLSELIPVLGCQ